MNIRIAASTWTFRDYDLERALEEISLSGVEYLEIFANNCHLDPRCGHLNIPKVKNVISELRLKPLSVHNPFSRLLPGDSLRKTRQDWVKLTKETIDRSAALDISSIVMHPFCLTHNERGETEAFDVADLIIDDIASYAAQKGIRILLENPGPLFYCAYQRAKDLIYLTSLESLAKMGVCLDTCHLICSNLDPASEIRLCGELLSSLHMSDNKTELRQDLHLPLGDGSINWSSLFNALRETEFSGNIVLEVAGGKSPLKKLMGSIQFLQKFMKFSENIPCCARG